MFGNEPSWLDLLSPLVDARYLGNFPQLRRVTSRFDMPPKKRGANSGMAAQGQLDLDPHLEDDMSDSPSSSGSCSDSSGSTQAQSQPGLSDPKNPSAAADAADAVPCDKEAGGDPGHASSKESSASGSDACKNGPAKRRKRRSKKNKKSKSARVKARAAKAAHSNKDAGQDVVMVTLGAQAVGAVLRIESV